MAHPSLRLAVLVLLASYYSAAAAAATEAAARNGRALVSSAFVHSRRRIRCHPTRSDVCVYGPSKGAIVWPLSLINAASTTRLWSTSSSNEPAGASSTIISTSTPSAVIFTDAVFDKIASRVQEHVRIPMVPSPIINYILTRALERMSQDLSPYLLGQVEDVLAAEATTSKQDDVSEDELNQLADQIARELTEKAVIDVPVLNAQQEYEVLSQIFRIVLAVVTTSEDERRQAFIASTQLIAQDLLSSTPERRMALVQKLNDKIDLPLLGEDQEALLLQRAVDMCADALSTLVPPPLLHSIKGESHDSLAEFKEFLIRKVNEKVDFFGMNEEQEGAMIRTMIDLLIESYVDPSATNLLRLKDKSVVPSSESYNPRTALERQLTLVQRDIDLSTTRYEREQARLAKQKDGILDQLQAVTDAATSTVMEMDEASTSYD